MRFELTNVFVKCKACTGFLRFFLVLFSLYASLDYVDELYMRTPINYDLCELYGHQLEVTTREAYSTIPLIPALDPIVFRKKTLQRY